MAFFEGSRSFQEWDTFQSTMSGMGLDQITAIYQQYYDAYAA